MDYDRRRPRGLRPKRPWSAALPPATMIGSVMVGKSTMVGTEREAADAYQTGRDGGRDLADTAAPTPAVGQAVGAAARGADRSPAAPLSDPVAGGSGRARRRRLVGLRYD